MTRPVFVVVNRHRIRLNARCGATERQPIFRLSRGKHGKPWYAYGLEFADGARLVSDPDSGASVWIETPRAAPLIGE